MTIYPCFLALKSVEGTFKISNMTITGPAPFGTPSDIIQHAKIILCAKVHTFGIKLNMVSTSKFIS